MKKLLVVLGILGIFIAASSGSAMAIPNPNGTVTAGEWDGFIVHATDGDEGGIPDNYDMSDVYILQVNTGGASDGLYMRIDVYGTPTTTGENLAVQAYTYSLFDYDNDTVNDDLIEVNKITGEVRVNSILTAGIFGVGPDAWEIFIPEGDLSAKALPGLTKDFRGFTYLDGGGDSADDRTPSEGKYTIIPEPGSMALLGMGLFGAIGAGFRRRRKR